MRRLTVLTLFLLASCSEGDKPEDDTAGTTSAPGDDTGSTASDAVDFDVVVERSYTGTKYCGPVELTTSSCNQAHLTVLHTDDEAEFGTLFTEHIKTDPPEIDLDGRIVLLSYLPICPSSDSKLHVDTVRVTDTTLEVEEVLVTPDWAGDMIGCPYSVITIPDTTSFTDIVTTLTKVWEE